MKWIIWLLSIFLLLTLESGLLGQFQFLPVVPWLGVILCAIALVVIGQPRELIFITVVVGVMLDLISSLPDGVLLLALSLAVYLTYYFIYLWLARDYHFWLLFVSAALVTLLYGFAVLGLMKLFSVIRLSSGIDYGWLITRKFIWYIILNAIFTYPVYWYVVGTKNLVEKIAKYK